MTTVAALDERTRDHSRRLDDVEPRVDELEQSFAGFKAEVKTAARFGSMIGAAITTLVVGVLATVVGGLIVYALTQTHPR
jgi:tetrahydromethanopterin S-methyltransferase subunit G